MTTFRLERLNREFLREISLLLQSRVKNAQVHGAVLTQVVCSKDLSHAKVFFTTMLPEDREPTRKALQEVAGFLRSLLGKQMRLRKIPELHFHCDETEERARSVEALLDTLAREEPRPPREEPEAP